VTVTSIYGIYDDVKHCVPSSAVSHDLWDIISKNTDK